MLHYYYSNLDYLEQMNKTGSHTKDAKAIQLKTSARDRSNLFPIRNILPSSSPSSCSRNHRVSSIFNNLNNHLILAWTNKNYFEQKKSLKIEKHYELHLQLTETVDDADGSNAFNFSNIRYTNTKAKNCNGLYSAERLIKIQAVCRKRRKDIVTQIVCMKISNIN